MIATSNILVTTLSQPEILSRSRRSPRTILEIKNAFGFYRLPNSQPAIFAMARPGGLNGAISGTPQEYVRLLQEYNIRTVINFTGGYNESNTPFFEAAQNVGIQVIDSPDNYIRDDLASISLNDINSARRAVRGEFILPQLLNAINVIDAALNQQSVCINCAAGQGRSGMILAALAIREALQKGEGNPTSIRMRGSREHRDTLVYSTVAEAVTRVRQGNSQAVENNRQLQALNRYYEHFQKRQSQSKFNLFRKKSSGSGSSGEGSKKAKSIDAGTTGSSGTSRSRHASEPNIQRGFWSQWWHNIKTLGDNLLHHRERINWDRLESAWLASSEFTTISLGDRVQRAIVESDSLTTEFVLHDSGDPQKYAKLRLSDIAASPESWRTVTQEDSFIVHAWVGKPYVQFEYTYRDGDDYYRIFKTVDVSNNLSASSDQLLNSAPTTEIWLFASNEEGDKSNAGWAALNDDRHMQGLAITRIKYENGSTYVESDNRENWVEGQFRLFAFSRGIVKSHIYLWHSELALVYPKLIAERAW